MRKWMWWAAAAVLALAVVPAALAQEPPDVTKFQTCRYCGMNLEMYNYSRMFVQYGDGSTDAMCSLHCAAVNLSVTLDKIPDTIWAADYVSKKPIPAESATWVIGGTKPGVMSARAKWAFATPDATEIFVKANGGTVANFDQALKAAYEDMYADVKMIRDRRAAKRAAGQTVPAPMPMP